MKKNLILASIAAMVFASCKNDDTATSGKQEIAVSFKDPSVTASEQETPVTIVFSKPTTSSGSISVKYTEQEAVYDTDYSLIPAGTAGTISVPYQAGVSQVSFTFKKISDAAENQQKSVTFQLHSVSDTSVKIQGNTSTVVSFNAIASLGGVMSPNVGGSTQPNQVFIDLSANTQTSVKRDSWDLAFYAGNEYRVAINGSMKMAVKKLETNDITQVVNSDPSVAVGTFVASNMAYVDNPNGSITSTAIAEISANDAENNVYLVNMGSEIPTTPASAGSVNVAGDSRGWMKIKINRATNGYKLLYAPIESTTFSEVTISKATAHNFTFFSLINKKVVEVEPQKTAWDLKFTTFTNEVPGNGSYFYSDFVTTNILGGVTAYMVDETTEGVSYSNFTAQNINSSKWSSNQTAIGSSWRSTMPLSLKTNVFYVIKDASDNIYKLKFTQMQEASTNERGYPKFEFKKL